MSGALRVIGSIVGKVRARPAAIGSTVVRLCSLAKNSWHGVSCRIHTRLDYRLLIFCLATFFFMELCRVLGSNYLQGTRLNPFAVLFPLGISPLFLLVFARVRTGRIRKAVLFPLYALSVCSAIQLALKAYSVISLSWYCIVGMAAAAASFAGEFRELGALLRQIEASGTHRTAGRPAVEILSDQCKFYLDRWAAALLALAAGLGVMMTILWGDVYATAPMARGQQLTDSAYMLIAFLGVVLLTGKWMAIPVYSVYARCPTVAFQLAQADDRRTRLYRDPRLAALDALSAVDLLNRQELQAWKSAVQGLPTCRTFHEGVITDQPTCPYCHLRPSQYASAANAEHALDQLDERLDDLLARWRGALQDNLSSETSQRSLQAMTPGERLPIEEFLTQPEGETRLPDGFVQSANQALRGIQAVTLSADALLEHLRAGGLPCREADVQRRFAGACAQSGSGTSLRAGPWSSASLGPARGERGGRGPSADAGGWASGFALRPDVGPLGWSAVGALAGHRAHLGRTARPGSLATGRAIGCPARRLSRGPRQARWLIPGVASVALCSPGCAAPADTPPRASRARLHGLREETGQS